MNRETRNRLAGRTGSISRAQVLQIKTFVSTKVLSVVPLVTGQLDAAAERKSLFQKSQRSSMGLRLSSIQYARDLAYVKAIGEIDSRVRTAEQSEIAEFWYEDSTLGWNRIANTVVRQRGLDNWSAARALALVNFAIADGFIAGFEAKYRFRFWRPETAIHEAATDGNRLTEADPAWKPFLITSPVPDHPSTHTVLGWAAAEVLIEILGDRMKYVADSLTLPGVTRDFRSLSAAAEENGMSRLYAGIHFRLAVKDGRRQGRSVGRAVADALAPVR